MGKVYVIGNADGSTYIRGADVSHAQGEIDWDVFSRFFKFAYIRVSRGDKYEDTRWREFYDGAKSAGIHVGPYHYFQNRYGGTAQAKFFRGLYSSVTWELPPAGDFEDKTVHVVQDVLHSSIRSFLDTSRSQVVYTSAGWWNEYVGRVGWARDYLLWVANWGVESPLLPVGWTDWFIWQYDVLGNQDAAKRGVFGQGAGLDLDLAKPFLAQQIAQRVSLTHSRASYTIPAYA